VGPPPHLSPTKRTVVRGLLVAAAAILLAGSIVALAVTAWGVSTVRVIAERHDLSSAMRTLDVDTGEVPVAIRITADREVRTPQISMRLVGNRGGDPHRMTVTAQGDQTQVRVEGGAQSVLGWARGGEITVTLPPDQARRMSVRTQQDTGVVVAEADLDQLIARSTDGPVVLRGAARSVEVQTVDGDVTARGPIAVTERFVVTTSDGDVAVDFRSPPPRTVEVTSRDGDVELGLPGFGPYLVRARSDDQTSVRVPETTDAAAAAAVVTAASGSGDVVIGEAGRTGR
jgi:hypothetical protein